MTKVETPWHERMKSAHPPLTTRFLGMDADGYAVVQTERGIVTLRSHGEYMVPGGTFYEVAKPHRVPFHFVGIRSAA